MFFLKLTIFNPDHFLSSLSFLLLLLTFIILAVHFPPSFGLFNGCFVGPVRGHLVGTKYLAIGLRKNKKINWCGHRMTFTLDSPLFKIFSSVLVTFWPLGTTILYPVFFFVLNPALNYQGHRFLPPRSNKVKLVFFTSKIETLKVSSHPEANSILKHYIF